MIDQPAFLKSIIAEGTVVKKGDVVAELESPRLIERIEAQKQRVRRIQAKIKDRSFHLEVAKIAVEEYEKGLSVQDRKTHESKIVLAKKSIETANKVLDFAKSREGDDRDLRVEAAEAGVMAANIDLEKAEIELKVFEMFSRGRKLAELREDVDRTSHVDAETQANLDYEKGRLERLTKMAASGKLVAPVDGRVAIVNGGASDPGPYDPGARIQPGQVVFMIESN